MIKIVNFLTILRLSLGIVIFILIAYKGNYMTAFILFLIAGLTDFLDGYFARKYDATSHLGEILDPIADKILIVFIFFGLSVNLSSYLVALSAAIIVSREIWISALRDYNSRNNNLSATKVIQISKYKTAVQLFTISVYLFGLAFNNMLMLVVGDIFLIVSVLITIYTGYVYTYQSIAPNKK